MKFKRKFKSKKIDKNSVKETDVNSHDHQAKDWFTKQYEKLIGKPVPREEVNIQEIIDTLKDLAKKRPVPEAKAFKNQVNTPDTGKIHYLKWSGPQIKMCKCPDEECTCLGDVMFPAKKIPRGDKYFKSSVCRRLLRRFRKPAPAPTKTFVQRLADMVGVEAALYKDLDRRGILSLRGAEFCPSRCIRYYGPGNMPNYKHLSAGHDARGGKQSRQFTAEDSEETYECDCGDDYSCTVATQSTVGPKGELIIGNCSHVLYGTPDECIVRDIEGTELQISSYKCDNDRAQSTDDFCSVNKLLYVIENMNMRGLKNHISLLKGHIFANVLKTKGNPATINTLPTQYEEQDINNKSSDKITIATPYKGVVIRVKKMTEECIKNNQPEHEVIEKQISTLPDPFKWISDSNGTNDISIKVSETFNATDSLTQKKSAYKETRTQYESYIPQKNDAPVQNLTTRESLLKRLSSMASEIFKACDIKVTENNIENKLSMISNNDDNNNIVKKEHDKNVIKQHLSNCGNIEFLEEKETKYSYKANQSLEKLKNQYITNLKQSNINLQANEVSKNSFRHKVLKKILQSSSFDVKQKRKSEELTKCTKSLHDNREFPIGNEFARSNNLKDFKPPDMHFEYNKKVIDSYDGTNETKINKLEIK